MISPAKTKTDVMMFDAVVNRISQFIYSHYINDTYSERFVRVFGISPSPSLTETDSNIGNEMVQFKNRFGS